MVVTSVRLDLAAAARAGLAVNSLCRTGILLLKPDTGWPSSAAKSAAWTLGACIDIDFVRAAAVSAFGVYGTGWAAPGQTEYQTASLWLVATSKYEVQASTLSKSVEAAVLHGNCVLYGCIDGPA